MKSYYAINVLGVTFFLTFLFLNIGNYYEGRTFQFGTSFLLTLWLGFLVTIGGIPYLMLPIWLASSKIEKKKKTKGYVLWILYPFVTFFLLNKLPGTLDGMSSTLLKKVTVEELESFALDAWENQPELFSQTSNTVEALMSRHPAVSNISSDKFNIVYGDSYVDLRWKTGFDSFVAIRTATNEKVEIPKGLEVLEVKQLTPQLLVWEFSG